MKEKIDALLRATAKAIDDYRKNYCAGADCGKSFSTILCSLERSLGSFQIRYDHLCGKDTLLVEGVTRKYIPRRGDTILLDLSVGKDGVWCDVCRTFFVGEMSARQKETYGLVKRSLKAGECALGAGVSAGAVFSAADGVYRANGKKLVHHAGHALGGEPLMPPRFIAGELEKLKRDSFVAVETGLYDGFGLRLEDDYYIGEFVENLSEKYMPSEAEEYVLHE